MEESGAVGRWRDLRIRGVSARRTGRLKISLDLIFCPVFAGVLAIAVAAQQCDNSGLSSPGNQIGRNYMGQGCGYCRSGSRIPILALQFGSQYLKAGRNAVDFQKGRMDDTSFHILEHLHYTHCAGPPSGFPPGGWITPVSLAASIARGLPETCGALVALIRQGHVRLEPGDASALRTITDHSRAMTEVLVQDSTKVAIRPDKISSYLEEQGRRSYSGTLGILKVEQEVSCGAAFVDLMGQSALPSEMRDSIRKDLRGFAGRIATELGGGEFDVKGDGIMYLFIVEPIQDRVMKFALEVGTGFPARSLRTTGTKPVFVRIVSHVGRLRWQFPRGAISASVLDWTFKTEEEVKDKLDKRPSVLVLSQELYQRLKGSVDLCFNGLVLKQGQVYYKHLDFLDEPKYPTSADRGTPVTTSHPEFVPSARLFDRIIDNVLYVIRGPKLSPLDHPDPVGLLRLVRISAPLCKTCESPLFAEEDVGESSASGHGLPTSVVCGRCQQATNFGMTRPATREELINQHTASLARELRTLVEEQGQRNRLVKLMREA